MLLHHWCRRLLMWCCCIACGSLQGQTAEATAKAASLQQTVTVRDAQIAQLRRELDSMHMLLMVSSCV
jgi:hypothetical protein